MQMYSIIQIQNNVMWDWQYSIIQPECEDIVSPTKHYYGSE